ncbi:alpha/beta fold hydrolase [Roseitranquillus sediminis]|uniref:alpha/beta fold hydrolase n=1 Tax=Roseitranquillus sediminis TaxID=2809051 RepID=UPI001D0C685E|nr:alpha/beta fold hydrolase [Roseitranquillus sediminis]MBM9593866.1 alpha/beta fold hydrolase [Roseitranquillus sediminis]
MSRTYVATRFGDILCRVEGDGPALLLIHQSGRSSRMFAEVLPLLGRRFRAVAVDLPGFGGSDPLPEGTTIEELADLLVEVMDGLGLGRAHVYGHHSGNKIAAALAGRRPDRLLRLVLAGQSHSIIPDRAERNAAIAKFTDPYTSVAAMPDPALAAVEKWAGTFRTASAAWWQPGVSAHEEHRARGRNAALDAIEAHGGSGRLYAANTAYDLESGYRGIPVPTLVLEIVTPEEDELIGRRAADVQALIPGARVAEIETPNGDGVTLEGHAPALAAVLEDFLLG